MSRCHGKGLALVHPAHQHAAGVSASVFASHEVPSRGEIDRSRESCFGQVILATNMLAAWRRPLAPLAHMPPSTPMMASRGTVSCVKVPPPTFISNVGGDTFTGAIVTRICFGCSSCTSGLRHPPWLHGLYGMQARIGETKNGFGKKLGSNEDRGTSSPFSLDQHETDQTTYKVSERPSARGVVHECSWWFWISKKWQHVSGWMSLDRCVSCMAAWRTTFTLRVGHLALGCHFHVDIFFFCVGVEMWDKVRNVDSQL